MLGFIYLLRVKDSVKEDRGESEVTSRGGKRDARRWKSVQQHVERRASQ